MHKLIVQNLCKSFANKQVLQDVSFRIETGQVIALLGSSGSGKSTLLRCINLLETPDAGSLQVDEDTLNFPMQSANKRHYQTIMHSLRKKVGMVFQQFHLWPHMTILDNLTAAPIHVLKREKSLVKKEALHTLTMLGVAEKAHNYPAQLSGGQQQRVAIARALVMNPEFILFDEPNSGLDPERSRAISFIIRALSAQGITQIVTTHDITFAQDVADAVLFLENGRILESVPVVNKQIMPKHPRFQEFLSLPPAPASSNPNAEKESAS